VRFEVVGSGGPFERGRRSLCGRPGEDGRLAPYGQLRRKVRMHLEVAGVAAAAAPRDAAGAAAVPRVVAGSTDCWTLDHPAGHRDHHVPAWAAAVVGARMRQRSAVMPRERDAVAHSNSIVPGRHTYL